jgi:serine protease inhibitor ecotin
MNLLPSLNPLGDIPGVAAQLNVNLETRIAQTLEGIDKAIKDAPSNLVLGLEFAAYKKIEPSLTEAVASLLVYIRENPEMSFGNAEVALEGVHQQLLACDKDKVEDLKVAVQAAFTAAKEQNIHIFGRSLAPVNLEGERFGFSQLRLKEGGDPAIALRAPPPGSPTTQEQRDAFAVQRDLLVKNLKRVALVELVYQYVIGGGTNHLREIYAQAGEADFEEALFRQIRADVEGKWWGYKAFSLLSSYLVYKVASFILAPFIKEIGRFGYDSIREGIDSLNKTENASALHDHIFESFKIFLDEMHGRYRAVAEMEKGTSGADEGAGGETIHQKVLLSFRKSKGIHLGRDSREFDNLLIDHLVQKMPLMYPIRLIIASSLKRADAISRLFEKIEEAKIDQDGFSYAIDEMLSGILEKLSAALEAPEDRDALERGSVSRVKRKQINDFFEALFDAIPLAELSTGNDLIKHLRKEQEEKGSYDLMVREQILLPAASGGVDSLSFALKKLLTPGFVQGVMTESLGALNRSYASTEVVTEEMKQEAKDRLGEVQARVLEIAVKKGMGEISTLNPDQERDEVNGAISALKERTQVFIEDFGGAVGAGDYDVLNGLWNVYIQDIKQQEKRGQKEGKIGSFLKQELSLNYYNKVAEAFIPLNGREVTLNHDLQGEYPAFIQRLQDVVTPMKHVLSYDIIGRSVAGFGKDSVKELVLKLLNDKVNSLFTLAFHPAMLPYGVGNYLIGRPLLLKEGVKNISIRA